MNKIKVGIFGTGFGSLVCLPAVKDIKSFELIGIFGRNKKKLLDINSKYKVPIFLNSERLMNKIEFAIIAMPPFLQFDFVKRSILKNINVLCEKPFTINRVQAQKLLKLSQNKKKLFFGISYQMRFQPLRLKIKKILEKKVLGEVLSVRLSYDYSSSLYNIKKKVGKTLLIKEEGS